MIPGSDVESDEKFRKTITCLVEHPIQLKPPDEPLHPQYLKVGLEAYFSLFHKVKPFFFAQEVSTFGAMPIRLNSTLKQSGSLTAPV